MPLPTSRRLKYRRPGAENIKALLAVETECFVAYYRAHRFSERQFRYYLKNPNTIATLATMDGEVVGYILGVTQRGRRKHTTRLYSIATLSRARRKGIGRALLRTFIREAKNRGAKRVSLEVAFENGVARRLFENEGFRQTRTMPNFYGKRHAGIQMEKII